VSAPKPERTIRRTAYSTGKSSVQEVGLHPCRSAHRSHLQVAWKSFDLARKWKLKEGPADLPPPPAAPDRRAAGRGRGQRLPRCGSDLDPRDAPRSRRCPSSTSCPSARSTTSRTTRRGRRASRTSARRPALSPGAGRRSRACRLTPTDVERHALDFAERTGFTFTVLEPGTEEVIGCLYIYAAKDGGDRRLVPGFALTSPSWMARCSPRCRAGTSSAGHSSARSTPIGL
jgi:hypothetical protein